MLPFAATSGQKATRPLDKTPDLSLSSNDQEFLVSPTCVTPVTIRPVEQKKSVPSRPWSKRKGQNCSRVLQNCFRILYTQRLATAGTKNYNSFIM